LTDFVVSNPVHVGHAVGMGAVVGVVSSMANAAQTTSANLALGTAIVGTLYMKEYGHGLPKAARKKLFRWYLKYNKWKMTAK